MDKVVDGESLSLHGSEQRVVMKSPFRDGSNIIAVKPAARRMSEQSLSTIDIRAQVDKTKNTNVPC